MSKTIINNEEVTVKTPQKFDPTLLKARQDAAVESYLKVPNIRVFEIRAGGFLEIIALFEQKTSEGYKRSPAHHHFSHPFSIPLLKKDEDMEAELQAVRDQVETTYKVEIEAQVAAAKAALIAQRKAHLEKQEQQKKEKQEQKVQSELEAEADALFSKYLDFTK